MKRVLLVDDEAGIREGFTMALKEEFEVRSASSGEEAFGLVGEFAPHVMILDQNMPGMTGMGLLEKLAGRAPATIMLSALADREMALKGSALGVVDVVSKPCYLSVLRQKLRKAAEQVEAQ